MNLSAQIKEHPMVTAAAAIAVVFSGVNITTFVQAVRRYDSLATHEYVDAQISQLEDKIDRIRAFTEVVPELRDLLTLRCMGVQNLDQSIDRLKREYRTLTNEDYQEPPCERLLPAGSA